MVTSNAYVLILAPIGRDGAVAEKILAEVGIRSLVCASLDMVLINLDQAGCAVVTEEALLSSDRRPLADWASRQPPWSDFPFIVLSSRGGGREGWSMSPRPLRAARGRGPRASLRSGRRRRAPWAR